MDALEFLKEYQRMCKSYKHCSDCPLHEKICLHDYAIVSAITENNLVRFISNVENWSRNHPIIIDWTKVPRNTPVLVCNSIDEGEWERQYFCAALMNSMSGNFLTFCGGDENNANGVTYWYYCRLAPEVDATPYLKEKEK